MNSIAFCGLGKRFESLVIQNELISERLKKYTIAGLIDQNKHGQEFILNGRKYTALSLEQWTDFDIGKVIITTNKYFDEVSGSLQQHGFKQEQICSLDELIKTVFTEFIQIGCYEDKKGLEVGGPSSIFSLIYDVCKSCDGVNFSDDTVWGKNRDSDCYMYNEHWLGKMIIADATDLSTIPDGSYDFVLSSNNLEHIANPMKAVKEFYRILRRGGILLVAVPNKEVTFDHNRKYTTFEHILKDYQNNTGEDDMSHLPEIIKYHDYDMDTACGGAEAFMARAERNIENRCLHHHVFDKECLNSLLLYFNIEVLGLAKVYSNYLIVGKK